MTTQFRLNCLEQRHQALKSELHKERIRPAFDDLKIHDIKRQKLYLKDQIEALKARDIRQKT